MHILFNGDSNMGGEELADKKLGMAGVITDYYSATATNLAVSGASNDLIYNSTWEYLQTNPAPDLVVIGWSEHGREQWYFENQFHEINQLDVGQQIPNEFRRRYQFWKNHIQKDPNWHRVMSYYWHNKIYNLHMWMYERKIPHLFFNAFHHFQIESEKEWMDWHCCFFCPYNERQCYVPFCIEHNYEELTPGWQHFEPAGHKAWADILINEINTSPAHAIIFEREQSLRRG